MAAALVAVGAPCTPQVLQEAASPLAFARKHCYPVKKWDIMDALRADGLAQVERENLQQSLKVALENDMLKWGRRKKWQIVLDDLQEMQNFGVEPDYDTFVVAVRGCWRSKRWQEAISLLRQAARSGEPLDSETYFLAVGACHTGGRWQHGFALIEEMRQNEVEIAKETLNVGIRLACKCARWEEGLAFLKEMEDRSMLFTPYPFLLVAKACMKAEKDDWAEFVEDWGEEYGFSVFS